jgi:hypothetical protein
MIKEDKSEFIEKALYKLNKIYDLHKKINHLNISLEKLYPVTIVQDNSFFVFDIDNMRKKYEFKLEYPTPMPFPKGVLAAFPLDFYEMKPSAVVSMEAFESLEGYACIFHEFVHCFQWEYCEEKLRGNLEIAKKAAVENNFMWEIIHSFPYEDEFFIKNTKEITNYFNNLDLCKVKNYYKCMREFLNNIDYEYMMWQQWKEGFARYIENLIRKELNINSDRNELMPPYERVHFYELGSSYIELLINDDPILKDDIEQLYYRMVNLL